MTVSTTPPRSFDARLAMADAAAASSTLGVVPTALAPLQGGSPPDPDTRARLTAAGVTDATGALLPAARRALVALASARSVIRLVLDTASATNDVAIYRADDRWVGVIQQAEGAHFLDPARTDDMIASIWAQLGASPTVGGDVDLRLGDAAASTLLVAIDRARDRRLAALSGSVAAPAALEDADLSGPSVTVTGRPSLAGLIGPLLRVAVPDRTSLEAAFGELEGAGLIVRRDQQPVLADQAVAIARDFALPGTVLHVQGANMAPAGLATVEFGAVQGSAIDLLLYERTAPDQVHLRRVSTNQVVAIVAGLIHGIGDLASSSSAASAPASPATSAPRFCRNCGKLLRATAAFCGGCGQKIQ